MCTLAIYSDGVVSAIDQRVFIASTVDIVEQNGTCTLAKPGIRVAVCTCIQRERKLSIHNLETELGEF